MSESADLLYNVLVLIVACNDLALNAEPCADEPELTVAVRGRSRGSRCLSLVEPVLLHGSLHPE